MYLTALRIGFYFDTDTYPGSVLKKWKNPDSGHEHFSIYWFLKTNKDLKKNLSFSAYFYAETCWTIQRLGCFNDLLSVDLHIISDPDPGSQNFKHWILSMELIMYHEGLAFLIIIEEGVGGTPGCYFVSKLIDWLLCSNQWILHRWNPQHQQLW